MNDIPVNVTINGRFQHHMVSARLSLADFLREKLGLTGTHLGCEHGVCGACTVLIDGRSARSCLTLACQIDGSSITTIEGLSARNQTTNLQASFSKHQALQCGFCTPGFLLAATELLENCPQPSEETVREALSGNICRCTGYQGIVNAVLDTAYPRESPRGHTPGQDAPHGHAGAPMGSRTIEEAGTRP